MEVGFWQWVVPAQEETEYSVGEIHESPAGLKMPFTWGICFTTRIFVLLTCI